MRASAASLRHFRCGGRLVGTTASSRMSVSRGWREKRRAGGCIELRGRLLPVKDGEIDTGDSGGESEGPDDSEPEFLDADEIEGGGKQVKSWRVPSSRVKIQTADSHEYVVNGSFPLDDPWWTVSVKVTPHQYQSYAKEPPSYELDDDGLGEKSILSLFLNKCGVSDEHRTYFMDWLSNYPPVTFSTWKEKANNFGTANIQNILKHIENSESGAMAFMALEIPLVMKYLPKLLPSKIRSLLTLDVSDEESSDNTLYAIEDMLAVDPWKLGFGLIIYRELHICGCEAAWESFCQCEDLLETIPALQTNALLIYREMKKKCMELGDTYVDLSELTSAVTKSQDMSVEAAWEALEFLKEYEIVVIEQKKVFLYSFYCYEVTIAEYIQKIVQRKTWNIDINENDIFGDGNEKQEKEPSNQSSSQCPTAAFCSAIGDGSDEDMELLQPPDCAAEPECPKLLDVDQKKAGKMILANPVTVISGKGGCGKTTVVSLVFKSMMQKESDEVEHACKALEEDIDASEEWFCDPMASSTNHNDSIRFLLTAPTGKAASLLKKKTGLPAATLHQVTCSYSAWKRLGNKDIKWKFSHVEALVVDEASLVSVRIFSAVLKLLYNHGRLAKLVILGDVRQLPSIEPGNLLADVFADLSRLNWAIELKTNHRAESQLIVDNATRISHQCCVEFDAFVHIDGHSSSKMPSEENKFILVSLADDVDLNAAISALLKNGPGLQDDKHSQFIAFRRKDCLLINDLCCIHYSKHTIKNRKSRFEFRCGDKVCCTKNAYVKDLLSRRRNCSEESNVASSDGIVTVSHLQLEDTGLPLGAGDPGAKDQAKKEIEDDRLCNGEIFFVVNDVEKDNIRELTLSDGEDRTYTLNYKLLRSRSGLRHAWARTIHTFQGSEEDTVIYVLGNTGWQNWKHVYTAVTRGRKRVYIIARKTQLDKAIASKARDRKTSLKQRLKEKLPQRKTFGQPAAMSSAQPESSQATEEQEAEVILTPHPLPYTQLKSPPRFSCPPVPTTPIAGSCTLGGRPEHADHLMRTPPDRIQGCELDQSPPQKRTAGPVDDSETPKKIRATNNRTNWAEESPNSQRFQQLSLQSPCHKKLFNP
ncbi:DNA helicase B [Ranitomeya variabilis]|uniref:DNA helicase B n=1 Tax=Ranitomeya variabilis TaxID=490064 RepID=UPI004055DC91